MINNLLKGIEEIYIAYGATDFRKQIDSLCEDVRTKFKLNPYSKTTAFIFCNKSRTSIKVLCYDKNGFILAQKKLLNTDKMKFQWPKDKSELGKISLTQLNWLLEGLQIYPKKYFKEIDIENQEIAS